MESLACRPKAIVNRNGPPVVLGECIFDSRQSVQNGFQIGSRGNVRQTPLQGLFQPVEAKPLNNEDDRSLWSLYRVTKAGFE